MPRQWYIKSTNGFKGPFSSQKLRQLARDGKLSPNTGISPDGESWHKAKQLSGLQFAVSQTPTETKQPKTKADKTPAGKTGDRWYIRTSMRVIGPISTKRLTRWAMESKIQPDTAVSHDKVKWTKAKRVPGVTFDNRHVVEPQLEQSQPAGPPLVELPCRERMPLPVIDELPIVGMIPTLQEFDSQLSTDLRAENDVRRQSVDTRRQSIRAAYHQHFGQLWQVDANSGAGEPPVDICFHPGSSERPFATLITNGVSDILMNVPGSQPSPIQAELILYANEPSPAYISLLRSIALIIVKQQRTFWPGATMANGEPSRPIFADSVLEGFAFLPPPVTTDQQLAESIKVDAQAVQLLWVLPISRAELDYAATHGMKSFCDLLNRSGCSPIVNPARQCLVSSTTAAAHENAG